MVRVERAFLDAGERGALRAFADGLVFVSGRQGTGYEKCDVAGRAEVGALVARALSALGVAADAPHDVWIIRYATGTAIPPHRDPVAPGKEHHRLNAIVAGADGGDVLVEGTPVALTEGDAYVFRPDAMEHEVTLVRGGTRLVFSVGTLR